MRVILCVFCVVYLAAASTSEQTAPDFSGTWKMDPSRSESAHQDAPIGPVWLVIHQSPDEFRLETRRSEPHSKVASTEVLTFHYDGKELLNPSSAGGPVKAKAHWDGRKLIAETERDINGATVTTMQIFELSPNGKEIAIQKSLTVQHGYRDPGPSQTTGSGRDVFVKAGR